MLREAEGVIVLSLSWVQHVSSTSCILLTYFSSPQATSTTAKNIISGKFGSCSASSCTSIVQLPHLMLGSHSSTVFRELSKCFFFFLMFSWKAFLFQEWVNTRCINTEREEGWGVQALGRLRAGVAVFTTSCDFDAPMWIKLLWKCYCNDPPINCTGVLCRHVLKCNPDFFMSVLLNNFWLNIWTCISLGKLTNCSNVYVFICMD